ncbi:hypothetical protein ACQKJG_18605 [Priestia megaterium]|uniref:hypothetical protein n=1 Tax=Priestia megaterium TaxID=1404 RepID=UPI003D06927C
MSQNNSVDPHEKMLEYVDKLMGRSSGMVKTASPSASRSNDSYKAYRSSFLTLSDMEIPSDYREIFRWCRYFFKFDPLVGAAIRSLATFPITDWILNDTEAADEHDIETDAKDSEEASKTYTFYENVLSDIGLYQHLIEVGYDYFLNANCIIFAEPGIKVVKRRNKETNQIYTEKEVVWKSVQRLDVTRVRIDKDPKTNEKVYYYDIPTALKRVIQTKHPEEKYKRIPEVFKKAVAKGGLVKLKSDYVYHIQMPSESGDDGTWATPRVLHVMKLILYTNVLRQAQEAIAREHIIPKRVYYFQETNEFSPNLDFAQAATDFAVELKKQLDDPNYQIVSPIPINQIQHSGQGKTLLLVPEIEQLNETILAGLGAPREFVLGGVSYSGSTTSLRILENHFITYRTSLLDYINNFLIKRLAEIRGEWETIDDDDKLVKVSFSELKMQDDIQQKQLMISLNQQGKLPDEVLFEDVLGLDSTKVNKQLQAERIRKMQEQVELQEKQMELQAKMEQKAQEMGQVPQMPPNAPVVPEPAPGTTETGMEEDPNAQAAEAQGEEAPAAQGEQSSQNKEQEAIEVAQKMVSMGEAERSYLVQKLPQATAQRALLYYNQLMAEQDDVDMRPYPDQKPPRRQVGGV